MATEVSVSPAAAGPTASAGPDWTRIGALAGVAFCIVLLVSFFATGSSTPNVDDSAAKVVSYSVKHHTAIMVGDYANALGVPFFLIFAVTVWSVLRRIGASSLSRAILPNAAAA